MAHRPESTNTRTPGPGPKYQLPSRLGETPGHTFPKTKREPVRPPRIVTPVRHPFCVICTLVPACPHVPWFDHVAARPPQGPGAYNLSADARLEEHSVAAMLRTMESGRAVTPKARNFYVKEARPGQTHVRVSSPCDGAFNLGVGGGRERGTHVASWCHHLSTTIMQASTPPPRQTTRTPGTMPRDGGSPGSPLRMHSPVRTPGMPLHMTHESVVSCCAVTPRLRRRSLT